MVIDPGNNISATGHQTGKAKSTPTAGGDKLGADQGGKSSHTSSDSVSISLTGQSLAKVEASLSKSSDVDAAKVAEVKAAIANGSYQIDADNIADKMLGQDDLLA